MTSTKRLATLVSLVSAPTAALAIALFPIGVAAEEAAVAPMAPDAVDANKVRVGMYFVHYNADAPNLSGPFIPPGYDLNLRVQHVNTPYFGFLRRVSPHFTVELAAGVPPTTHTYGKGSAKVGSIPFDGQEVATVKWFSPTLLLEYNFCEEGSAWRPYIGVGVNYTHFYDRGTTANGVAIVGGPTATFLSDSIGPALTLGLVYKISRKIDLNASYSIAEVNSQFDAITAGVSRTTEVHFNPGTAVVSVGYSF